MNRRDWLSISGAVGGGALVWSQRQRKFEEDLRPLRARVAGVRADAYSENLDQLLFDGIRLFNLGLRGRSVLLKPNMVEYIPGKPVNTDPRLLGATAEGPGPHRDTDLVVHETGLGDQLSQRKIPFVDLNRDELIKTKLRANYSGLGHLWLPRTVLASDFIVSMPKGQ